MIDGFVLRLLTESGNDTSSMQPAGPGLGSVVNEFLSEWRRELARGGTEGSEQGRDGRHGLGKREEEDYKEEDASPSVKRRKGSRVVREPSPAPLLVLPAGRGEGGRGEGEAQEVGKVVDPIHEHSLVDKLIEELVSSSHSRG